MRTPNAYLFFRQDDGTAQRSYLWVDSVAQGHALAGSSYQSLSYSHFYSRSNNPGLMHVEGRVPTQGHYDRLAQYVRDHHELLITLRGASNLAIGPLGDSGTSLNTMGSADIQDLQTERGPTYNTASYALPLIRFAVPSEGLQIDGIIESFIAGQKRFNVAPPFTFDIRVIRDHGSANNEITASYPQLSIWSLDLETIEINKTRVETISKNLDQYGNESGEPSGFTWPDFW